MSWQDNRRRRRIWYAHYKYLADRVLALMSPPPHPDGARLVAAEALVRLLWDVYEQHRLHRNQRIASSAFDSMVLACQDAGLDRISIDPSLYPDAAGVGRPPCRGEFIERSRTVITIETETARNSDRVTPF
jgi:hypothetical protein